MPPNSEAMLSIAYEFHNSGARCCHRFAMPPNSWPPIYELVGHISLGGGSFGFRIYVRVKVFSCLSGGGGESRRYGTDSNPAAVTV